MPKTLTTDRIRKKKDIFDFPSEQRSYWDPAKPELDLSEAQASEVFVYGISDSAAGSVFSTLLREFDHCTFKTLAQMVWEDEADGSLTPTQSWFRRVSEQVEAWRQENVLRQELSITSQWHYALRAERVQRALYASDAALNNCLQKRYLRTMRRVFVAIKRGKTVNAKLKALESQTDVDLTWMPGDQLAAELLMSRAWPENRILAASLFPQLELYLVDISHDAPGRLQISRDKSRMRITYKIEGNGVKVAPLGNAFPEMPFLGRQFKYVLNCGSPDYFQQRGNRRVPKAIVGTEEVNLPLWTRFRRAMRWSA